MKKAQFTPPLGPSILTGISVDALADGQLEVNLLDIGVSAEDITAMRRIDARIEEARRAQQQALEAEPSE